MGKRPWDSMLLAVIEKRSECCDKVDKQGDRWILSLGGLFESSKAFAKPLNIIVPRREIDLAKRSRGIF